MAKKNRRLFVISGGVLVLFLLAIITWVIVVFLTRPSYQMPDTSDWQTGDIFFSVGDSWKSVAVRSLSGAKKFEVSDSTPSHCGVVIRDADSIKLVHASTVAEKVVAETIEEYLTNNGSYCLFVKKTLPTPDTIAFRHTVDSLIANNVPFDFDFDHKESASLYCTEMVITVFELNGISCFSSLRKQSYIYPEDLLKLCIDNRTLENDDTKKQHSIDHSLHRNIDSCRQ